MYRIASVSDLHCPYLHPVVWQEALQVLRDYEPDVFVLNGDLMDTPGASRFRSEEKHDWMEEILSSARALREVRDVLPPECERHYLLGNHCKRITREAGDVSPYFRDALHWKNIKGADEFEHWQERNYEFKMGGFLKRGPFVHFHGVACGATGDHLEAWKIAKIVGDWDICVVRGHTHRLKDVTQATRTAQIPVPLHYANTGTLCDIDLMTWAEEMDTSEWKPGVFLGEWSGNEWDAEVVAL